MEKAPTRVRLPPPPPQVANPNPAPLGAGFGFVLFLNNLGKIKPKSLSHFSVWWKLLWLRVLSAWLGLSVTGNRLG